MHPMMGRAPLHYALNVLALRSAILLIFIIIVILLLFFFFRKARAASASLPPWPSPTEGLGRMMLLRTCSQATDGDEGASCQSGVLSTKASGRAPVCRKTKSRDRRPTQRSRAKNPLQEPPATASSSLSSSPSAVVVVAVLLVVVVVTARGEAERPWEDERANRESSASQTFDSRAASSEASIVRKGGMVASRLTLMSSSHSITPRKTPFR